MQINISKNRIETTKKWLDKNAVWLIVFVLSIISILSFVHYYQNGYGLAYNDARSHLDIGRRVVEGLKPGLAQLGSVWLPLTHFLMMFTIWNDFMWHSGLAGALWSMIGFVGTGVLVYMFLREIGANLWGRFTGVAVLSANINVLFLQSTAMTELVLLFTMTAGAYVFLLWFKQERIIYLILSAFWIMLATLVRYDGWFMFVAAIALLFLYNIIARGYKKTEGIFFLFCSLGGLGIVLWLLWNTLIFNDPLYFIFGPFSAHTQQDQLEQAGVLATKYNWYLSAKTYLYAMAYNTGALTMILGTIGAITFWFNQRVKPGIRVASLVLFAPLGFNILALYLGHSVLFVPDLFGETWFNVRYGMMMMPSFAIFIGYLVSRAKAARPVLLLTFVVLAFFSFYSVDAVTIDDALTGSSGKNVSEVSGWLKENAQESEDLVLISVASHDAIIFSSGLKMSRYIHEGAGIYYEETLRDPEHWARWIIMRSFSDDDSTWRAMWGNPDYEKYEMVDHYPFADIYQLKPEYVGGLYDREYMDDFVEKKEEEYKRMGLAKKRESVIKNEENKDREYSVKNEAELIMNHNSWVELSETGLANYVALMQEKAEVGESVKYRLAYFIEFGTDSNLELSQDERMHAIESFYINKGWLPETAVDWRDVVLGLASNN
jgi:hypothetical protein